MSHEYHSKGQHAQDNKVEDLLQLLREGAALLQLALRHEHLQELVVREQPAQRQRLHVRIGGVSAW